MLGRTYERENCSAARALEFVGERWSLLIIRNAMFAGATRFNEFQRMLGIAPNTRECVPPRQGLDLQPVILALTEGGHRGPAPRGPPVNYEHDGCGGRV